jgi:hypothetical protein
LTSGKKAANEQAKAGQPLYGQYTGRVFPLKEDTGVTHLFPIGFKRFRFGIGLLLELSAGGVACCSFVKINK